MPVVTVPVSSNGLPMATTGSLTSTLAELRSSSGVSFSAGMSTSMMATTVDSCTPTSVAEVSSLLEKVTVIVLALATT